MPAVKPVRRFKMLRKGLRSQSGSAPRWVIGEWKDLGTSYLHLCVSGFHCSDHFLDALSYIPEGEVVAVVETRGRSVRQKKTGVADKSAWRHMRVVAAYRWTMADARALLAYLRKNEGENVYRDWWEASLKRANRYDLALSISKYRGRPDPAKIDRWILKRLKAHKIVPSKKAKK